MAEKLKFSKESIKALDKIFVNREKRMTLEEAKRMLGDRASWELKAMKKALSSMPIINSAEENRRLQAVKIMLRKRK